MLAGLSWVRLHDWACLGLSKDLKCCRLWIRLGWFYLAIGCHSKVDALVGEERGQYRPVQYLTWLASQGLMTVQPDIRVAERESSWNGTAVNFTQWLIGSCQAVSQWGLLDHCDCKDLLLCFTTYALSSQPAVIWEGQSKVKPGVHRYLLWTFERQ